MLIQGNVLVIAELLGLAHVTKVPDQVYTYGDPMRGRVVGPGSLPVRELEASLHFVLPHLDPGRSGVYNVFTVARGLPGRRHKDPRYWNPVTLAPVNGGVYLYGTYDAARGRLGVRMNVGNDSPKLVGFYFDDLPTERIVKRVLRLHVLIRGDVLYATLESVDGGEEILVYRDRAATGKELHPWGASSEGHWFLTSGVGKDDDDHSLGFPPGFGLSDFRVAVRTGPEGADHTPLYSGALDHLTRDTSLEDGTPEREWTFSGFLAEMAADLRGMGAGATTWSTKAEWWAEEAERLRLDLADEFDPDGGHDDLWF